MLDRPRHYLINPALNRLAAILVRRQVSADQVTRAGLALGLAAACIAANQPLAAAVLRVALIGTASGFLAFAVMAVRVRAGWQLFLEAR